MKIMSTPKSVDIEITNRCNLHCSYCGYFTSAADTGRELSVKEWLSFFEELNHCAVLDVTLSGGEPFIRKDLKELIDGIVRNRMRFSLLSNGTLITGEIAGFLSSTGRCDHIQVSIDGSTPTTHDAIRGKGSFFKALEGIKQLKKHHLSVGVRVTITRSNLRDLERIAVLLLEEIGLESFSTNSASYMGLCRQNTEQVGLTPQERSLAMERLLKLNKRYGNRIGAMAGPLAEARDWTMMETARREKRRPMPGRGHLTACEVAMSKISVRADGTIVPCSQLAHIELGRINRDDLREIWQNHSELKRLRRRRNIPLSGFEFCRDCDYINYCTGNCPALAYTILGNEYHPSPDACLKRFLGAGGRLPDESSLSPVGRGLG